MKEENNNNDEYINIIEQIKQLDIMELTPIKAMNILNDIVEEVKKMGK